MAINSNVLAENQATVLAEDGNTMYATIQMRHGKESEMDKSKFIPAEMGVATDTRKVFIAFAPNNVEEMALKKDIPDGTADYTDLENKPSIGGVTVEGNKTLEDYNIQPKGDYLTEVPDGYVKDEDLQLSLAKKLDKNQGTENAGKTLVVGKDGNVIHGGNLESLAIKLTASGDSPLSIRDSSEWKVQNFAMQGKTEQVQTTGAQLIEYPYLNDSQTINGVMFSVLNQGEIRVQGEATQTVNFPLYSFNYKNGKSYYISGCPKGGSSGTYNIRTGNGRAIDTGDGITYSPNEDGSTNININIQTGTKVNGLIFKPMLNSGSEALPYEPYTGGQPSPSPDYPQEIINAGKYNEETQKWEYEISVGGANILNISSAILQSSEKPSGLTDNGFTVVNTETNSLGRIVYVYVPKKLEKGKQYIIHIQADAKVSTFLPDIDQYGIRYNQPFSPKETVGKIGVYVDKDVYGEFEVRNIMLNEGTEPLPYEPYRTPQTLTLQSDRPLTKWDKLEKRDGQWGWVYKSETKIFTGEQNEIWSKRETALYGSLFLTDYKSFANGNDVTYQSICDKLIPYKGEWDAMPLYHFQNVDHVLGIDLEESISTVETLKTWLSGNPLTVCYETAEETFVPLTEAEQSALETLTTYFPTSIIAVESGELAPEIEMEYVADTKTYIDNKFTELAQNLAATQNTLLEV